MARLSSQPPRRHRWRRLLTVPTATFQLLHVFFVIHHDRRRILRLAITDHPHAEWALQQLREAFQFDSAPRHLILDRDGKYGNLVPDTLRAWGVKPVRISPRSPWQNGVVERWVLSDRRELLDHVVVLSADHLRRLLRTYVAYYHEDRCHLSLGKDSPNGRTATPRPSPAATVIALPPDVTQLASCREPRLAIAPMPCLTRA